MRITNKRLVQQHNGRIRVSCDLEFENRDGSFKDFYLETPIAYSEGLHPSAEGFIIATYIAARHLGEERILIDEPVCERLISNLEKLGLLHSTWFGETASRTRIESTAGIIPKLPPQHSASCAFLSGGVDSFSMVYDNICRYPEDDPRAFSHVFLVYGLDIGDPNKIPRYDIFDQTVKKLQTTLASKNRILIPVYTNFRYLLKEWKIYEKQQFGSLLSAIAHFFSNNFSSASIALDLPVNEYCNNPYGSHPWANQYLSSSKMKIKSEMDNLTRLEKINLISKWPEALDSLRICFNMKDISNGKINCGHCTKCILTKLEMLVVGTLEKASSFPVQKVDISDLEKIKFNYTGFWEELIQPLRKIGHNDFADLIQYKLDHNENVWAQDKSRKSLTAWIVNCVYRIFNSKNI